MKVNIGPPLPPPSQPTKFPYLAKLGRGYGLVTGDHDTDPVILLADSDGRPYSGATSRGACVGRYSTYKGAIIRLSGSVTLEND